MVILRTRNKITDFLMILAWASPFNIEHFLKSLKLTWLRRTIRESLSWQIALHQVIKKRPFIWAFGSNYLQTHIKSIDNPFWRGILAAYISLVDKISIECFNEILNKPLNDGHKFSDLKQRLKIKGTYLDYIRLQKNLPKT